MGLVNTIINAYRWIATPVPNPSTGNQAFQWFQELPQAYAFTPGLVPFKQFVNVLQPQTITIDTQTTAGLGGLQAGQLISQGLVANNDTSKEDSQA